jgi:transposase
MTDHTPMPRVTRLDVISTGARRRWTLEGKQRIVAESYSGPRLVSATARRHGLSASQLFAWRRLARMGRLVEDDDAVTFAQAVVACEPSTDIPIALSEGPKTAESSPLSACPVVASSRMEIVLGRGQRVIVDNSVDAAALARVIGVLERHR